MAGKTVLLAALFLILIFLFYLIVTTTKQCCKMKKEAFLPRSYFATPSPDQADAWALQTNPLPAADDIDEAAGGFQQADNIEPAKPLTDVKNPWMFPNIRLT